MFMIMFVLDDRSFLDQVLTAWSEVGVSGATIIESTGLYRHHVKHIPMRYTYGDSSSDEMGNITIFAIVENEALIQLCLQRVEKIVGNLDNPNTGIFSAWPLSITKGIPSGD